MNKKLLSSSALVGALLVSGAALAEFKVGGDITATYTMASDDNTAGLNSNDRIGNETNIKFTGTQALNNGWTASYAGKLELDGAAGTGYDHEYELKLGTGNAYVAFANDGGLSHRGSLTPFVSYPIGSTANAITPATSAFNGDSTINAAHTSNNIAVGGKVGGGDFVLRYAPQANASATGNDIDNINADDSTTLGSAYLVAYNGKFGPVGLNLGYTVEEAITDSTTDDAKEQRIGLSYGIGAVKLGADYIKFTSGSTTGVGDKNTTIVGAAYAVNDKVTIGAYYQNTTDEKDATPGQDEEMKMISIGYNLGAASVALSVIDVQDAAATTTAGITTFNAAATQSDYQGIMITTKVGF